MWIFYPEKPQWIKPNWPPVWSACLKTTSHRPERCCRVSCFRTDCSRTRCESWQLQASATIHAHLLHARHPTKRLMHVLIYPSQRPVSQSRKWTGLVTFPGHHRSFEEAQGPLTCQDNIPQHLSGNQTLELSGLETGCTRDLGHGSWQELASGFWPRPMGRSEAFCFNLHTRSGNIYESWMCRSWGAHGGRFCSRLAQQSQPSCLSTPIHTTEASSHGWWLCSTST